MIFATGWSIEYVNSLDEDTINEACVFDQVIGIDMPWVRHAKLVTLMKQFMGDTKAKVEDELPGMKMAEDYKPESVKKAERFYDKVAQKVKEQKKLKKKAPKPPK